MIRLRHRHPIHPSLTTNDYTKSIYFNMLAEFPVDDVVRYFAEHPMEWEGRRASTFELLTRLGSEKAKVPTVWDYEVGEDLDRFLSERGRSLIDFYRVLLFRNNRSTYVPGRFLLKWFYPVLKLVFNSMDPRDMAIRLIPHFTENLLPHHVHRRVKRSMEGEWTESILLYITDDRFEEPIHFDSEIHSCEQIKACPGVIGLPPFEVVGILSESRPVQKAVWAGKVEERSDVILIDGLKVGHRIPFSGFCRDLGLDLSEYKVPDAACVMMDSDIRCPIRNRIVLRAGCAYDAPVYLQRIRHKNTLTYSLDILNHMVTDWDEDEAPLTAAVKPAHKAALALAQEKISVRWHPKDESITLNGEHLVKGIPARILRKLLAIYQERGQKIFIYREFKRDAEISQDQKRANFEVRFYRLVERLNEKGGGISIHKSGRGRFELLVKGRLEFSEDG